MAGLVSLQVAPGTTTNGGDLTGSTDGTRINVVSNRCDDIPAGRYFNPAAFAVPAKGSFGNAGANIFYGPRTTNWDLLTKRVRPREGRLLSVRGEAFNISGARIDPNFGLAGAARLPRNVQLSARFVF